MEPKLMLIAVYEGTASLDNILKNPASPVLLQLLSEPLAPVVRICGRQSGRSVAKVSRLAQKHEIDYVDGLPYFVRAAGILRIEKHSLTRCGGDHQLLVGTVTMAKNLSDETILTTDYLRSNGLIR